MSYSKYIAYFTPHSTVSQNEMYTYERFKSKLDAGDFEHAVEEITTDNILEKNIGFSANIFNKIENKLNEFCMFFLNKFVAEEDEYYSIEEPTESEMEGKTYWIKPY